MKLDPLHEPERVATSLYSRSIRALNTTEFLIINCGHSILEKVQENWLSLPETKELLSVGTKDPKKSCEVQAVKEPQLQPDIWFTRLAR